MVHPRRVLATCTTIMLAMFTTVAAAPPQEPTSAEERLADYALHEQMRADSPFAQMDWQFLGPASISGRVTDIAVQTPRGGSYTMFAAAASGGVWRTRNEGLTWEPVFEQAPSTSIGDVTIAPSNPDIVWIGTGEANIFRSSMAGAGVFKSIDGGDSWTYMGLGATHTIPRIVIHPTDPDTVYVAASGREWTPNADRGIYKTTDGGVTWTQIHYVDEFTGAIDLVMDPSDPETLYASTWERVRKKWNDPRTEAGYDGSGIYKSTDGGATWQAINEGLPTAEYRGRIGIDIARANPRVLYAFLDNYEVARMPGEDETDAYGRPRAPVIKGATVYRSDDAGATWIKTSEDTPYMQGLGGTYGWVFGQIRVDPVNENKIYVLGLALNVSEDSGKTFRRLSGMHGDHHGLWIDPTNTDYLVNTNDGGVYVSYDGGENWRSFTRNTMSNGCCTDHLPVVQFFNVGHDMDTPFRVYGSVQDHGSFRGVVDLSRGRHAIPATDWERAPGGEGSTHQIDPGDPATVYSAGFYGDISRTNMTTLENTSIMPQPEEGELAFRGQWIAPFVLSPHDSNTIYHGLNFLFRSRDRGDTWERISPDLTYNDPDKFGDIPYQTIYSISESPLKAGLLYVGTDDGRVWSTEAASMSGWSEITGELPQGKFIAEIVASAHDLNTVYSVQNGKRDDDFTPYVWKSTDRGKTWRDITGNIPSGPVNVIKEDPEHANLLYVGTDLGAYVTINGGQTWFVLGADLPSTFVQDMIVHPRDEILVAATHGRGMWAMDIRPLRALAAMYPQDGLHVFDPEGVQLPRGFFGFFGGQRPSAYLTFWVPAEATDSDATATVEIADIEGNVVRTLRPDTVAGFNAVSWDLTPDGATPSAPGPGGFGRPPRRVAAGVYTVTVRIGEQQASSMLRITG